MQKKSKVMTPIPMDCHPDALTGSVNPCFPFRATKNGDAVMRALHDRPARRQRAIAV